MKESMPSRVQPVQAAQKPVICPRDSLVCGWTSANAALDMLLMTLFSVASLYWSFPNKNTTVAIRQPPKRTLV
jgi:hypothetical protein